MCKSFGRIGECTSHLIFKVSCFLFIAITLPACQPDLDFDKTRWLEEVDGYYPRREAMLEDLTTNHKLKGLTYSELVELLGKPMITDNLNVLSYDVVTDFGTDIDPVYNKDLMFILNSDSIVMSFKIVENKHGQ